MFRACRCRPRRLERSGDARSRESLMRQRGWKGSRRPPETSLGLSTVRSEVFVLNGTLVETKKTRKREIQDKFDERQSVKNK